MTPIPPRLWEMITKNPKLLTTDSKHPLDHNTLSSINPKKLIPMFYN